MTTREAGIKLTLNSGSFVATMNQLPREAATVGSKIKAGLNAGFKGVGGEMFKGGKDSIKELAGGIKSAIGAAATLGGALSFGAGAKGALDLVGSFKDLAFQISNGTGKAVTWQEVQADIEGAAGRWKQSTENVTEAYKQLFDETGDLQFTADATDAVTMAATASGKSINSLASIAGTLNEKFGIAGDEMEDALASVLELSSKGGVTVEDLGEKLGMVGASAKEMGLEGKEGLQQVLGMMNIGDNVTGSFKKNLKAVSDLTETFGNADKLKAIEKDLHVKLTDKSGAAQKGAFDKILAKSGGKQQILSKIFSGDTLKLVSEFGKVYQKTFAETAGTAERKTKAALDAFHKALTEAGKTSLTAAQLEADAKKRAAEDPQRQFDDAMNKFKAAFTKPEMLAAMLKLAKLMPRIVDGLSELLDFVTEHPLLSGGGALGAKIGGDVLGAGISQIASNIGAVIKDALSSGGSTAASDMKSAVIGSASAWGSVASKGFAGAAALAIGYEIGQAVIDARMSEKEASQKQSIATDIEANAALNKRDPKAIAEARDKLQADYERQKKDYNSFSIDPLMNRLAGAVDKDYKAPEVTQMQNTLKSIDELTAALATLTEKTVAATKGTEDMATGTKKAGQAAQQASQQLSGITGTQPPDTTGNGTSKGPGGRPSNVPGHAHGG